MRKSVQDMQDKIKVSDLKAHLHFLRGEIAKEVGKLNLLKEDTEYLNKSNNNILRTISVGTKNLERIANNIEEEERRMSKLQYHVLEEEATIDYLKKEHEIVEEGLLSEEKELQISISNLGKTLASSKDKSEKDIEASKIVSSRILAQVKARKEEKDELQKEKKELESLLVRLEKEKKSADKELVVQEQLVEGVICKNEEEAKKNVLVVESLIGREKNLADRERNYQVLKSRFRRVFNKLYPDQNLDNLI